jgi:BASS family bile acid:Na+ symporter
LQESLDLVTLNFNKDSLFLLNICLAFIMFGVAIELKADDFKLLFKHPKAIFTGLVSQFILLPAITFLLVWIIEPTAGIALGMILVAACPGGNVSNFFSILSKGNVALSVSITAIASSLAVILTPLNFTFWASMYEPTNKLIKSVSLDVYGIVITIIFVLLVPLIIGMWVNHTNPTFTAKYSSIIRKISILIFSVFIVIGLASNFDYFLNYIHIILIFVLVHNALAFVTGYTTGLLVGLPEKDKRSVAIETGIQNSGLALVLIFDFFNGLGSMAIVAAWWGIWHLIAGFTLSWYWSKK